MAAYIVIGVLAAFGLVSALWIGCGAFLCSCKRGICILPGMLDQDALETAKRWIWLREMGLLPMPLVALRDRVTQAQSVWLESHGFQLCDIEELCKLLELGAKSS